VGSDIRAIDTLVRYSRHRPIAALSGRMDYLNMTIDRQRDLAQREVELIRDLNMSAEALANGLATATVGL
jgi:hypothetical protein